MELNQMTDEINQAAIAYHSAEPSGKLEIRATKPLASQRDLALAYSPGVAAACMAIADENSAAGQLTARGNLIAVISNGTAVLGLGDIGPLASKPVMEGKAVLFKKFSGIDVFDIEVNEKDPDKFIEVVARLEPTFGGINLEDIAAPECFEIESKLRERMNIPVFHDDQHGTAIVTAAGVLNGLKIAGKTIANCRLVASGAGAAAIACLNLLVSLGLRRENIIVCDRNGVIHTGRTEQMDRSKKAYAVDTSARTLAEAIKGADIFLGLSTGGVLKKDMVTEMADKPLIFALANPNPEISPEDAVSVKPDAIIATGRSDYPNQINNVLCFPFIFRGALDVGAKTINEEMKLACTQAIAKIAEAEASDRVMSVYGAEKLSFGPEYIVPKPFDPRLVVEVPIAVAKAAMSSGAATRPIEDFKAYREKLSGYVFRSGSLMKPVFDRASDDPRKVIFADGEDDRVLQAAQQCVESGIARPIVIGRRHSIEQRIAYLGLGLTLDGQLQIVDPDESESVAECVSVYQELVGRQGVTPKEAERKVLTEPTVLALLKLRCGSADAAICGTVGRFENHLEHLIKIIGKAEGVQDLSTLNALILPSGTWFMADTYVSPDPTAEEIVELTMLSVANLRRFGIEPKVALLSHSNFGGRQSSSARKMQDAMAELIQRSPDFEVDGEMHADAALSETIRRNALPHMRFSGQANLWIMPNLDAAHISFNLLKQLGGGVSVGPIMLGSAQPAHIVAQSVTVRGLQNMAAVAVVDAQGRNAEHQTAQLRAV
jgi:malate dehydrogenase (oxaloacetate-decarboxylating)(NADP+)